MGNPLGLEDDSQGTVSTDPNALPFASSPEAEPDVSDEELLGQTPDELEDSPLIAPQAVPEAGQPQPTPSAAPAVAVPEAGQEEPWLRPGQFRTPDDALRSYDDIRVLQDRTAARAAAAEARAAEAEAMLQQIAPLLQRAPAPLPPPQVDQLVAQARASGMDDDQIRMTLAFADQVSQQRAQQVQTEVQRQIAASMATETTRRSEAAEQAQLQQVRQAAENTTREFLTRNSIAPGTPDYAALQQVLQDPQLEIFAADDPGSLENLTEPAVLEFALEMARDPYLLSTVRGQPSLWETNDGMQTARELARWRRDNSGAPAAPATNGQPAPAPTAPVVAAPLAPAAPAPAAPVAPARVPHVESGGSGNAPEQADDEWEVLKLVRNERKRISSPLGI